MTETLPVSLHRGGFPAVGSDSLDPLFSRRQPHRELASSASRLTPREAMQAARAAPPNSSPRKDVGTVETGKTADLVLLDANPWKIIAILVRSLL